MSLPSSSASREVTRLEGFSDAVFGFAITLLVVSLEVPATYDDLVAAFRGLPVFAITFALLLLVWHEHHTFFRQFGLQDGVTIWLNGLLLFVVMVYIYPLKFLFVMLAGFRTRGLAAVAAAAFARCLRFLLLPAGRERRQRHQEDPLTGAAQGVRETLPKRASFCTPELPLATARPK